MKTSARNQFEGTVSRIRSGAVNDEIEIDAGQGVRLVATVTGESRAALGLEVGATAFAWIKSSSIVLATELDGVLLSARNRLDGRVAAVTPGAVNAEVAIELEGSGALVAIVTQASLATLGLAIGSEVTALFKASSVIVGTRR